jgi:superfamily II DNA or RNA helicase
MIELFPDQADALARVLAVYKERPVGGKALVVAATGWGKTVWFSFLIQAIGEGKPVLIIAHRDELLEQAREKILKVIPTAIIGKVGGGSHDYGAPITVAGIDTISGTRHLKNLHKFGYELIICDECHHAPAPKYQKVFNALPDVFRVGVTATDKRLDGQELEPIFGTPLFKMNIIQAIQAGRLCMLRAIAIATETVLENINISKNMDGEKDFNQHDLALAVDTPARNRRVVEGYLKYAEGKRGICFAVNIAHAQALSDAFNDRHVPAAVISGSTPIPVRKMLYEGLHEGELKMLVSVGVLTEGFDEERIEVVVMARPTQSWALYMQCIGRGARVARDYPSKKECLIIDLTDNCKKHKLVPQNLSRALGVEIKHEETVESALVRAEKREQEAKVRKLTEKRVSDFHVNMFEMLEWKELANGNYVLEVTDDKHKIALLPLKSNPDLFEVWAKIYPSRPNCKSQKWADAQELQYAQMFAERQAKLLHDNPGQISLFDKNESWRDRKIDPNSKQVKKLERHHIEWNENMTKGEASDLIDAHLARVAREKAVKAARKAAKAKDMEAYA